VRTEWDRDWRPKLTLEGKPRVRTAAHLGEAAMRRLIPVSQDGSNGRRPGYARDSIDTVEGGSGGNYHFDVGATARTPTGFPYPAVLEWGSGPHLITSHGDYPLRDKHGNVFGKTVHHPGTPEYAWCRRAVAELAGLVL
jgi:hypothetical protein